MKTRFAISALLTILFLSFNLFAATRSQNVSKLMLPQTDNFHFEIIAGQHIPVGNLDVWSDQGFVFVKYTTSDNWFLIETHLHLAMDWRDIPQNKNGNPIPGHFAYQMEHNYVTEYTYQIPLSDYKGIPRYGAAHCVVVKMENGKPIQKETGWARNKVPPYFGFPGHNWAYYFEMRN